MLAFAAALAQPLQPTLIAGGDQGAVEEPRQPAELRRVQLPHQRPDLRSEAAGNDTAGK